MTSTSAVLFNRKW